MGTIQYGNGEEIHIEDRALAHLKVVIATKFGFKGGVVADGLDADARGVAGQVRDGDLVEVDDRHGGRLRARRA